MINTVEENMIKSFIGNNFKKSHFLKKGNIIQYKNKSYFCEKFSDYAKTKGYLTKE